MIGKVILSNLKTVPISREQQTEMSIPEKQKFIFTAIDLVGMKLKV